MNTRISAASLLGAIATVFFMYAAPAQAQATRTWVSGVGDDANPCSRTAPCKTFAGAISKTAANGEIDCLDPGGFGAVTILKSLTIDCTGTFGSILNSGVNGIIINFDAGFTAVGDRKTVRIRGISINGTGTTFGTNGIRIIGAAAASGGQVFVEDVVIDTDFSGTARGISDERNGGGRLFVTNTTVRNMGNCGIQVQSSIAGGAVVDVSLNNVRIHNSSNGACMFANAHAVISRSVISGNSAVGLYNEGQTNLSDSVVSGNSIGVQAANGTVRLAGNDISFNNTGLTGGGALQSFGTNRIGGNNSVGTVPTLLSPALQ